MAYFNEEEFGLAEDKAARAKYLLDCDKRVDVTIDVLTIEVTRVVYLSAPDEKPVTAMTAITNLMQDASDEELIEAVEANLIKAML